MVMQRLISIIKCLFIYDENYWLDFFPKRITSQLNIKDKQKLIYGYAIL